MKFELTLLENIPYVGLTQTSLVSISRSSRPQVFLIVGVLKILENFQETSRGGVLLKWNWWLSAVVVFHCDQIPSENYW